MKNIFNIMDAKTMFRINLVSIFITAICAVFSLYVFLTKGQADDLEKWKYLIILSSLILLSLLFLGSLASLIVFLRIKNKRK